MCPATLIDESLPKIVVDGLVDTAYTSGRDNELALVTYRHIIAAIRVDLVMNLRKESCVVVPEELVAARAALAEILPTQI